jgi:chromosome segregation and condensation protein ScpB
MVARERSGMMQRPAYLEIVRNFLEYMATHVFWKLPSLAEEIDEGLTLLA